MTENSQFYDAAVPDWPGEIDFYRELLSDVERQAGSVLEVACGTGRVAARLAQLGVRVVGIDRSADFLAGAQAKTATLSNVRWEKADMRSFDLGETFALVLIPGHAFQHMLTPADQVTCLENIRRHLLPGGRLVVHLDHQDIDWLGELCGARGGVFEPTQLVVHPQTGRRVQVYESWSYERATQTATLRTRREILDEHGSVAEVDEHDPMPLHCVFPFEMQHLLVRVGFAVEAVYGDFLRQPLGDQSAEMIWVARKA